MKATTDGNWSNAAKRLPDGQVISPWTARATKKYLIAGGSSIIAARVDTKEDRGIIQNEADWFLISAHGKPTGQVCVEGATDMVDPSEVDWRKDLERVFIMACSVLNIDNLNGEPGHNYSPGRSWAQTGPKYLFGYNYNAPADDHPQHTDPFFTSKIVERYFLYRDSYGDTKAWGYANEAMADGRLDSPYNACVIDVASRIYWYCKSGGTLRKPLTSLTRNHDSEWP